MTDGNFDEQVFRFFDNELSDSEFADLQWTLTTSAAARRRYLQLAELHGLLPCLVALPMQQSVGQIGKFFTSRMQPRWWMSRVASVAALIVIGLALTVIWERQRRPLVTLRVAPGSLVATTHPEAATGAKMPTANTLGIGSRLQLKQGVVALEFASGVKAFVSGPADLTLISKNQLRLDDGRARVTVPPREVGFTVAAPGLEVMDLGTEFGVVARPPDQGSEVHVFVGKVSATASGGRSEVVNAGLARRAKEGGTNLREIPVEPSLFPATVPNSLPYLHWSFDEIAGSGLRVDGNHPAIPGLKSKLVQSDGRPAATRLVSGVKGRALAFDGVGDYVESNWPGIDGNKPRTIVMWVRYPQGMLARYDLGGIVWGTRVSPDEPVCWKFNFMASAPTPDLHLANPPVAVPYITFGRWWRYGSTNLADGKWHCIAVTYSGALGTDGLPDVSLYADGKPEVCTSVDHRKSQRDQPLKIDTRIDHPRSTPMVMGRSQERLQADDKVPHRYFGGEIDELYIFEGVLDPTAIQNLSETRNLGETR